MQRQLTLTFALFFFVTLAFAQKTVSGKVVEAKTGEPLVGASINIVGTVQGTTSNVNGYFTIPADAKEIAVSYLGFQTVTVPIQDSMLIALESASVRMEEINIFSDGILGIPVIKVSNTLTPRELTANNNTLITPALNRIPGVYMHSGALNTNRITIRGIGNRSPFGTAKIRAFWNDIPLTTGVGETTIEDIDLSVLDGVDVLKGPASSVYGAGLGGLIQLRTDANRYAPEKSASYHTTVGSYGLLRNVAQFSYGEADKYNLRININDTRSDGYRENNEYDRTTFTALGKFYQPNGHLSFLVNYTDQKAFIPSSINADDFENNPEVAAANWASIRGFEDYDRTLFGLSYRSDWADWLTNTTSVFASFRKNYEPRPFNILRENNQAQGGRTTFDFSIFSNTKANLNLLAGMEFFHEDYSWQTYETLDKGILGNILSDNDETRQYANFFTQARLDLNTRFLLTVGLNYNTTDYDLIDRYTLDNEDFSGDYSFEPILSPYLSATYDLTEKGSMDAILFGIVSHGFSPPSLEETLTPEGQINPEIQPERGWNFELGSRGRYRGFSYTLSAYTMRIEDLLVARRTALDAFVGINAGRTVHNGLEIALDYEWHNDKWSFSPYLNYAYADYRFDEFVDGDDDFSGNELTGTAPHILSSGFFVERNFGESRLYGNLGYQFVDAMPITDANSIYSESYDVLDAKIGYLFTFGEGWQVDIYAGINNLWDENYASMLLINSVGFGGRQPRYYYPGLPRNYYGGMQLKYSF